MKKTIAILCPYTRDIRELLRIEKHVPYKFIFDDLTRNWFDHLVYKNSHQRMLTGTIYENIEKIVNTYKNTEIHGFFSSRDYLGSIISSIVADRLKLRGPSPLSVLSCQHKYYSRCFQQKHVPEAVPQFCMIDKNTLLEDITISYPLFMKPAKSYFSINAYKISGLDDLKKYISMYNFSNDFVAPFDLLLKKYMPYARSAGGIVLESYLEGQQVTLEGYVYNGKIHIFGVTDSIMFSGTTSFKRFEYPSSLPENVQERMSAITRKFMLGIGFDNSLFNIEFFYYSKKDTISIIEVNSRMASQFADLYEKVDGFNSYHIALDIAVGNEPKPLFRKGTWSLASSCVLRTFKNKRIVKMPSQEHINRIYKLFPDARLELYGKKGETLTPLLQDGMSYRYGLVHLGGKDRQDILKRFQICKKLLDYKFTSI